MATKKENTIIAISGKRGVGKTTAAIYLQEKFGFKRVSFAETLKRHAEVLVPGINRVMGVKGKEKPFFKSGESARQFLISFGQFMRYWDEDYWIKASGIDTAEGLIVIDDLRFKNEAKYLKAKGAKLIRINRYEHINCYGKNLDDPSETDLDDFKEWDYVIEDCTNVTIDDLMKQCDRAMKDLGVK